MDLSLSNAHVLYHKNTEAKLSFPQFRLEVVRGLLNLEVEEHLRSSDPTHLRPTGRQFPQQIPKEDSSKILQRQCQLCKMKNIKRRSTYECNICHEALCIAPCFEIYHTKLELP